MNLTTQTHHHPYPWPKPITKITRPSTPCWSHKQTTSHTAKTTHTHSQNPSPKLLDHQPHADLTSCHHHHQQHHCCTICHPSKITTKNSYQNHPNQTNHNKSKTQTQTPHRHHRNHHKKWVFVQGLTQNPLPPCPCHPLTQNSLLHKSKSHYPLPLNTKSTATAVPHHRSTHNPDQPTPQTHFVTTDHQPKPTLPPLPHNPSHC